MNENNSPQQAGEKKVGPIVATLIIVLVLIIAALYVFASKVNQPAIPTDASMETASTSNIAPNSPQDIQSLQNELQGSTNGLDKQNF